MLEFHQLKLSNDMQTNLKMRENITNNAKHMFEDTTTLNAPNILPFLVRMLRFSTFWYA
jgi:hypothetical protein